MLASGIWRLLPPPPSQRLKQSESRLERASTRARARRHLRLQLLEVAPILADEPANLLGTDRYSYDDELEQLACFLYSLLRAARFAEAGSRRSAPRQKAKSALMRSSPRIQHIDHLRWANQDN